MDGPLSESPLRRAGLWGAVGVSAVVACAMGALLILSWVRQSRVEKELARARTLLEEARSRLGSPKPDPVPKPEAPSPPAAGEAERREIGRLEGERAELERRSKKQAAEIAALTSRLERLQREIDRLTREGLAGRPGGRRAAPGDDRADPLTEHMRLTEETRALRDRLKTMLDAFEDLMLEEVARRDR